jgi:hypothetical protein
VEALIAAILGAYIVGFFNSSQTELSSAFVHIRSFGGLLALLSISAISIIGYHLFQRYKPILLLQSLYNRMKSKTKSIFKGTGKHEASQVIFEHLNEHIFKPLVSFDLESTRSKE